ncbi:hypothetical protein PFISCL1PPCAC_6998, partial [Pristionchus fissidentatus]
LLVATLLFTVLLSPTESVWCQSCAEANAYWCTGASCLDNYCVYQRVTELATGLRSVVLSCAPNNFVLFDDGIRVTVNGGCDKRTIAGIEYASEVCNTGDYCDFHCSGSSFISITLSIMLFAVITLIKL